MENPNQPNSRMLAPNSEEIIDLKDLKKPEDFIAKHEAIYTEKINKILDQTPPSTDNQPSSAELINNAERAVSDFVSGLASSSSKHLDAVSDISKRHKLTPEESEKYKVKPSSLQNAFNGLDNEEPN